ncbi:MAG TPA: HepT-like ribonuclease domain-containing protein [Stellaceae bacterium]|nr:HepT-like ribonuclease domain-containing protein [Stellaceae bacterium]
MRRDPKSLLWDALDAANAVASFTARKSFDDLENDALLRSAVERKLEIIGEALSQLVQLDASMAAKVPDLREIVAFRNILVHGYAFIDYTRVWGVIEADSPKLGRTLKTLLGSNRKKPVEKQAPIWSAEEAMIGAIVAGKRETSLAYFARCR